MATVERMAWELAEARLHDTTEDVCRAWDAPCNAVGIALEGRSTGADLGGLLAAVDSASAVARAEVVEALRLVEPSGRGGRMGA
jgi:hypothetical protein